MSARTAVVTGAGSGIGLAIAERLSVDGWLVVGVERDDAHGERFSDVTGAAGRMIHGDVVDHGVLERAARVGAEAGVLTGWVNNAAVNIRGDLHEPRMEEVEELFRVNLLAPFRGCSVAVRSFLRHGVPGRILNVSSIHGTHSFPNFAAYDTAKGGLNALTRHVAVAYGPVGIRANAIAPGAIRTEMMAATIREAADPARMERDVSNLHPLERIGEPGEVASTAAFLLGDESSFVTGQILGVDGGASARAYRFESSVRPQDSVERA